MSRTKEIQACIPALLDRLYGIKEATITPIFGGRLSDTFLIKTGTENSPQFRFLKIPHHHDTNTAFSIQVSEEGRKIGFPFPRTYPGNDGKFLQTIKKGRNIPDYLHGIDITLVDYHKPPEQIPDMPENQHLIDAIYGVMGKYVGEYHRFNNFIADIPPSDIPKDPLTPESIRTLLHTTFCLSGHPDAAKIDAQATEMSHRLTGDDDTTRAFAASLREGNLSLLLAQLDVLAAEEATIREGLPVGLINNDVKHNNLFINLNPMVPKNGQNQVPVISLAFDLDMATKGPLVKDLGRAIALTCFDKKTGELQPEHMLALIKGRHQENPLLPQEIDALDHYIKLGIIASYALRTSYFAEELQGRPPHYSFDRPNPALHAVELASFEAWRKEHDFKTELNISDNQKGNTMSQERVNYPAYPEKPEAPKVTLLGPGPLTPLEMTPENEEAYWTGMKTKYGFGSIKDTNGRLHRDNGVRADGTTGSEGLFRNTISLLKQVTHLPEESKVFFAEGGHNAANVGHANLFATEPEVPVVAICNGGFSGEVWGADLNEYAKKKALDKVILVTVQDGESATAAQVQKALQEAGVAEGSPFNITFTSNETSTGVIFPKQAMIDILKIPGRKRALIDASSGWMVQDIPGLTQESMDDDGLTRGVSAFITGQKGLRIDPDYTAFVICKDDIECLSKERREAARIPMPKAIRVDTSELDAGTLKRSSRVAGCLTAHYGLTCLQQLQERGIDPITEAKKRSAYVHNAVEKHPDFIPYVKNPDNRSSYNCVIVASNPALNTLTPKQRQAVIQEAHELLADEKLATTVKPYGNRGDFRFTTLDIESEEEAAKTLHAFSYAVNKALLKMQHKTFDLIAEDQFLYSTTAEVDAAIGKKTQELAAQGITFIDARNGLPIERQAHWDKRDMLLHETRYYTGLERGHYVIYHPNLKSADIPAEYKKIQASTLNPCSIIVAAKTVPEDASFDIFVREGAGVNNLPLKRAHEEEHIVVNCPGVNSKVTSNNTLNAVAQHRHIQNFSNMAVTGQASALNLAPLYGKSPQVDTEALSTHVQGKIVTVLGAGDIGAQTIFGLLASTAKEVRVYSRSLAGTFTAEQMKAIQQQYPKLHICDTIDAAMDSSNIAINHLALVAGEGGTKDAVTQQHLLSMADGAEIIDASRPGIIHPQALIDAHKTGKLARVVVDFDTPDKAPTDDAIKALFNYAKEHANTFLYSPHAFADTCPDTRDTMLDTALQQTQEIRNEKNIYNFAGQGAVPEGFEDAGKRKPDGIGKLEEILKKIVPPVTQLDQLSPTQQPFELTSALIL